MGDYKEFIKNNVIIPRQLFELCLLLSSDSENYLIESENSINEMSQILSKAGIHIERTDNSLFDILRRVGKKVGNIFISAYKASRGTDEDRQRFKQELKSSRVTSGDIVNFLLQLDNATVHVLAIPIHTIEAVTGWHISADLHNKRAEHGTEQKDVQGEIRGIVKALDKDLTVIQNKSVRERLSKATNILRDLLKMKLFKKEIVDIKRRGR